MHQQMLNFNVRLEHCAKLVTYTTTVVQAKLEESKKKEDTISQTITEMRQDVCSSFAPPWISSSFPLVLYLISKISFFHSMWQH